MLLGFLSTSHFSAALCADPATPVAQAEFTESRLSRTEIRGSLLTSYSSAFALLDSDA